MLIYFQASKMNVAALGNIVPQLHVHVIARKDNDISWPNPVWNNLETTPYIEKDANILIMDIKHSILDLVADE
jgi:diadenosine tetraphosphate (Ap4A) HIT family hydrolase